MTVYMVQMGGGGPVKIGHTKNLAARLNSYRASWPYELIILATNSGGLSDERALHWHLITERLRAEWFHPSPLVLRTAIDLQAGRLGLEPMRRPLPGAYSPKLARNPNDAQQAIRTLCLRFGGPAPMQRAMALPEDIDKSNGRRVSNWLANGEIPTKFFPAIVAAAKKKGIPVSLDELNALPRMRRAV